MSTPYSNGNTYGSRNWFDRYWRENSLGYRDREPLVELLRPGEEGPVLSSSGIKSTRLTHSAGFLQKNFPDTCDTFSKQADGAVPVVREIPSIRGKGMGMKRFTVVPRKLSGRAVVKRLRDEGTGRRGVAGGGIDDQEEVSTMDTQTKEPVTVSPTKASPVVTAANPGFLAVFALPPARARD